MLRGTATLIVAGAWYLALDVIERLVVAPLVGLRPAWRRTVLRRWAGFVAGSTLWIVRRVGGARIDLPARIPARSGVLVLVNHQSLMDIPMVFKCLEGDYPRLVTRRRYARGVPLVSHMLRLYEHPLVDPGRTSRGDLEALAKTAAESPSAVVVFPEGHRTRDGEIRPFKKAGVGAILASRPWSVYLIVLDGLWRCARLADFVRTIGSVRARVEWLGPIEFRGSGENADAFLDEMRSRMCAKLSEIRESSGR
jgi:1-acyl-sn-glycerol-3-phosphate acyltransferase